MLTYQEKINDEVGNEEPDLDEDGEEGLNDFWREYTNSEKEQ